MDAPADTPPPEVEIQLWDWPIRLIHWSLVLLIPAMWASAEFGNLGVHRVLGYVLLGLLLFRLYWGVFGSATARFAGFVRGPGAILRYLRSGTAAIGHNPLGALSVIALLGMLGLQIGLGLFAQDTDGMVAGPLAERVSYETSNAAADWHETLFNVLLALIGLHLAAILYYLLRKRDNLVGAMVTGRKRLPAATVQPAVASTARAVIGIGLSVGVTLWIAYGAPLP